MAAIIKADFNGNGSNDLIYQQTTALQSDQAQSIFFDPALNSFDVFTPQVNTPGLVATSIGDFDGDGNPEILYYEVETGSNFLLNPLESVPWTFLGTPEDPQAILQTPGLIPTASVDLSGDGIPEIVYVNNDNPNFSEGQNFSYDPVTRQFGLLNVTTDVPLAGGNFDSDSAPELIYGNPLSGEYRIYNFDTGVFEPLNPQDPNQTVPGYLVTGTLNVEETQPDLIVFQSQDNAQTVTFNRASGTFEQILSVTPGYISLA